MRLGFEVTGAFGKQSISLNGFCSLKFGYHSGFSVSVQRSQPRLLGGQVLFHTQYSFNSIFTFLGDQLHLLSFHVVGVGLTQPLESELSS